MAGDTCDCCQREGVVGVASSCLGAISFAWCRPCLDHGAEPAWMLMFTFQMTEGQCAEWVRGLSTWVDGKYVTWDEWVKDKVVDPTFFDQEEDGEKENGR